MGEKVLLVEYDTALRETLAQGLAQQGYEVTWAADGQTALELARRERPDLVVLDHGLPVLDGLSLCQALRQEMATPILLIAAGAEEEDRVAGLEAGADDYLSRPFGMREFLVRVRALLRRPERARAGHEPAQQDISPRLHLGDLEIDVDRREVRRNGQVLHLKPREYNLLAFLSRNPGVALSREAILKEVWGWDRPDHTRTVDVHICWLRGKIEPDPGNPRRIITVRGFGYRLSLIHI